MQALHLMALEPVAETYADHNSYGFRRGRSTADAMEQCFRALSKAGSAEWVLEGDIKGCFDHISHSWLLAHIPMDTGILEKWLKSGYLEQSNWFATEAGTPQGGIISPTLANLTLDGLEVLLKQCFPQEVKKGQIRFRSKVHLVRYADDFIITGSSRELLVNEVLPLVEEFLRERGLTLSAEKTHVTRIEDGFDFLGQHLRKYRGKLLMKPSRKNTKAFLTKVRGVIEDSKTVTQADLIARLNPVIRGWVNYHRHCVANRAFRRVDFEIWRKLWRWCCRRHPTKNAHWVKARYFHIMGRRRWTFAARTGTHAAPGQPDCTRLIYADETPIRRHWKIKGAANPFDPQWRSYFLQRSLASGSARKKTPS